MLKNYLFVSLVLSSCAVNAEIFKCVDGTGNVEFKALPCANEQKTEWVRETESDKRERLRLEQQKRYEEQQKAMRQASLEADQALKRKRLAEENAELRWRPTTIFPDNVKSGILAYLKVVLKDPDSLKDLEWLKTETDEANFRVTAFYRAKNGYGAYGISQQQFTTDSSGNVLDMKDLNE